jgi:hypothetical protein
LLNKLILLVNLQEHYPDRHTNVELSSGDDDVSKIDAMVAEPRALAGYEADGEEISLAEPIIPSPIISNTPAQVDPSVADRGISSAPSTGGQKWKCPPPIPKRKSIKSSIDQVMIQIELPPYRGPRRPLDLVAIEIVFGHLFKVF